MLDWSIPKLFYLCLKTASLMMVILICSTTKYASATRAESAVWIGRRPSVFINARRRIQMRLYNPDRSGVRKISTRITLIAMPFISPLLGAKVASILPSKTLGSKKSRNLCWLDQRPVIWNLGLIDQHLVVSWFLVISWIDHHLVIGWLSCVLEVSETKLSWIDQHLVINWLNWIDQHLVISIPGWIDQYLVISWIDNISSLVGWAVCDLSERNLSWISQGLVISWLSWIYQRLVIRSPGWIAQYLVVSRFLVISWIDNISSSVGWAVCLNSVGETWAGFISVSASVGWGVCLYLARGTCAGFMNVSLSVGWTGFINFLSSVAFWASADINVSSSES